MARARASSGSQPARLKPVGVTDDGTELLLGRRADSKGGYRLPIDESLVAQLEVARTRVRKRLADQEPLEEPDAPPPPPKPAPQLSIKEIQVALRQGKSVASVARKAGVDPEWVARFEAPVIWERVGMAQRAQRATLYRARMGQSGSPLGESVELNLRSRRVPMGKSEFFEAWDSVKRSRGGRWIVSFRFESRSRNRTAQWEYDPLNNKLRALDPLASELGWVLPRKRRRKS